MSRTLNSFGLSSQVKGSVTNFMIRGPPFGSKQWKFALEHKGRLSARNDFNASADSRCEGHTGGNCPLTLSPFEIGHMMTGKTWAVTLATMSLISSSMAR